MLMTRRDMLRNAGSLAALTLLGQLPLQAQERQPAATPLRKILVIGAHPDDPETGAGGTICLLTQAGHEVMCVYLTRGEAGIAGKSHAEAAAIRMAECERACAITGARHRFLSQVDGATEINQQRYLEMRQLLEQECPDVVLTHWPIDSHRDHAVCGLLVLDAWRRLDRRFDLYYFEVMTGTQTQLFQPTDWVNIESVLERKHRACHCHVSQQLDEVISGWHAPMERFRGIECRCQAAEAFVRHAEPTTITQDNKLTHNET